MRKPLLNKELKATLLAASLMAAIVTTATTLANGCGTADEVFDCQSVCNRYHDCYNADYDVDACRDRCESDASNSDDKQNKLDACHDCIGDQNSCVSDIANCVQSCRAFVP